MARYIPGINGPLVGSIGSDTYSKNRYGFYVKKKPIPTNPNTPDQAEQRNWLKQLVAYWKTTLTAEQSDAWGHAAGLHKRSKWGYVFNLSGINLFIAVNSLRLKAGLTIASGPAIFNGSVASPLPTISADATGKLQVSAWTEDSASIIMFVYATNAVSQTVHYKNAPFVFDTWLSKTTGLPVLIDVVYPGFDGDKYRVFVGYKFLDHMGAVSELIHTNYDGTRTIA